MPSVSKCALIFKNRVLEFQQDIEIVDILCSAQRSEDLLNDENNLFKYLNPNKHKSLLRRSANNTSKKIVINHLRSTVFSAYIKDIFEELSCYLKNLLYEAALLSSDKGNAKRLIGDHKITFSGAEILQFSTIDDLIAEVADDIIQILENERSTKNLIKKICNKIDLSIDETLIDEALPYLELRHKFVHTNGKVDDEFKNKFPMFSYSDSNFVKLNYQILGKARTKITLLITSIDKAAIDKGILQPNTPIKCTNETS